MAVGWGEVSTWVRSAAKVLPDTFVRDPLRALYFQGPPLWGLGGWGGIAPEDICAQMTSVPAVTWRAFRMEDCSALLNTRFESVMVAVWASIYAYCAYKFISLLWFRYFVLGPILTEIRGAFQLKPIQQ